MVYRGKPSAGCTQCREAKKRCDLGRPACSRCEKLEKLCSGYRDTSKLRIQNESDNIKRKFARRQNESSPKTGQLSMTECPLDSTRSSSSTSDGATQSTPGENVTVLPINNAIAQDLLPLLSLFDPEVIIPLGSVPPLDGLFAATLSRSEHHYGPRNGRQCGSVQADSKAILVPTTGAWAAVSLNQISSTRQHYKQSRESYTDPLIHLVLVLHDPRRRLSDETIAAVALLSQYKRHKSEGTGYVQSWETSVEEGIQLLQFRGKNLLKTPLGRAAYREIRAQAVNMCLWKGIGVLSLFLQWQEELTFRSPDQESIAPSDQLFLLCHELASLRFRMRYQEVSDADAMNVAFGLELRLVEWSSKNEQCMSLHRHDLPVSQTLNIGNGSVVRFYETASTPNVWHAYRETRIMLARTQEMLFCRIDVPQCEQVRFFRSVQQELAEEISAGRTHERENAVYTNGAIFVCERV